MIDMVELFNACIYIQDHLEADLSLLFLARTAGLSRFRFHRIFKAWCGETLHDFVTRMRMERAAFELSYPIPRSTRRSIKSIAFSSGYKSLSSFSHAFSAYAQVSPREFRNRALQRRPARPAGACFGAFEIAVSQEPARDIAVLDPAAKPCDDSRLAGLSRLAENPAIGGARYGVELLPHVFARARPDGGATPAVPRLSCVGVPADDWHLWSRLGGRRATAPASALRLTAGRYAVLRGEGSLTSLYRAWRRGFDQWLSTTGECPKPGRLFVRFEPAADGGGPSTLALYVPLEDVATISPHPQARRMLRSSRGESQP